MNLFAFDKSLAMEELKRRAEELVPRICEPQRKMVWGRGSLESPVVLVGEAPGDCEERQGQPFVGPAGRLLDRELARVGISREGLYITNIVKCRPTWTVGDRVSNRPPRIDEVREWMPYLMEELEIIAPTIIVCMGGISARCLLGKGFALSKERGNWMEGPLGTVAMATFHPAYLLRFQGTLNGEALLEFQQDLKKVRRRLEEMGELQRVAA